MVSKEWQLNNCKGCYYADLEKVGTGDPCCTYPFTLIPDKNGNCRSRETQEEVDRQYKELEAHDES